MNAIPEVDRIITGLEEDLAVRLEEKPLDSTMRYLQPQWWKAERPHVSDTPR